VESSCERGDKPSGFFKILRTSGLATELEASVAVPSSTDLQGLASQQTEPITATVVAPGGILLLVCSTNCSLHLGVMPLAPLIRTVNNLLMWTEL
jgi:hypothetical protein